MVFYYIIYRYINRRKNYQVQTKHLREKNGNGLYPGW